MQTNQSVIGRFCLHGLLFFITTLCLSACQSLRENPHISQNACGNCHMAERTLLLNARNKQISSADKASSPTRLMKHDLNALCTRCHKGSKGDHAVGLKPEINRYSLPLDEEGKINCATSCHNIHPDTKGSKDYLRQPARSLCLSCHDK